MDVPETSRENAWRRWRFAQFPYRPGDRLPPPQPTPTGVEKNYLQFVFTTPSEVRREQRVIFLRGEMQRRGTDALYGTHSDEWAMPVVTDVAAYHRPQLVPV